jgi:hypothetical protein
MTQYNMNQYNSPEAESQYPDPEQSRLPNFAWLGQAQQQIATNGPPNGPIHAGPVVHDGYTSPHKIERRSCQQNSYDSLAFDASRAEFALFSAGLRSQSRDDADDAEFLREATSGSALYPEFARLS